LVLTNAGGVMAFASGTINTKAANVNNATNFAVGDGVGAATYHLQGGIHSFTNGLTVNTNAQITGCGTITGNVVNFGTIIQDCAPGLLTFTGIVTNNGTM